jgi:hypothetical protein
MKTYESHPYITFSSKLKYVIVIIISWVDRNLKSNYEEVRAHFLSAHELYHGTRMSSEPAWQWNRLLTGSHVSGAFGDFYDNPDPNIRRWKRQRIFGTVTGACSEGKYTVQFQ